MARIFIHLTEWTGPALATKLKDKVNNLDQDSYNRGKAIVHYATTPIGDRVQYSALIEYESSDH